MIGGVSVPIGWLIVLALDGVVGFVLLGLYIQEARGERRPGKLSGYRWRLVSIVGLALVAAIRGFVFKG